MKHIWSAVLATGCAVVSAWAQAVAIRCDTCRVDSDFRAEAVRRGPGTHIVYNVKDNLVQQWYVGSDGDTVLAAVKAPPTPIVQQQTPSAGATQELANAHTFHVIDGGTIRPIYNIPIEMLGLNSHAREKSAYDYVTDANLRAMVESATGSSSLIRQVTGSGTTASLANPHRANLLFRVVFKDGSYVGVIVDVNQANGKSEPGSERTAAGQSIPKQASELSGTWTNNGGDNLAPMVALMQRLGGTVSDAGSAGAGDTITAIVCVAQHCTVARSAS